MMSFINKKRNKKGFTLVELVVVIAILGILAAIAVPKFNDVTANAKDKANQANVKSIEGAAQMYVAANPTRTSEVNWNTNTTEAGISSYLKTPLLNPKTNLGYTVVISTSGAITITGD